MTAQRVTALQMTSEADVHNNLAHAARLIARAAGDGAGLIALPENFAHMGRSETEKLAIKETYGDGPIQEFLAEQASKHGIWLVGGTIPIASGDPDRVRASCLLYDDNGEVAARYDKIHLFDVVLGDDNREQYAESETVRAGTDVVVCDSPFGRIGLAVCYDLRFPELFRSQLDQGMELLVLPSAFTAITGKAHWQPLLQARAIENLCYVIAPNQGGKHASGRETWGHSMIVDPWGRILGEVDNSCCISAEIDREQMAITRQNFPVLEHRKISIVSNDRK